MGEDRGRIVVLDDEAAIGEMIAETAEIVGLNCIVTHTVADFWMALRQETDAVLLDLILPQTDGVEVLRQLGAQHFTPPIVLLSGLDGRVLKSAADAAGSLGLNLAGRLSKPFSLQELMAMLVTLRQTKSAAVPEPGRSLLSEGEVRSALDGDFFEIHFQPQIELRTGETEGVEALVRLSHPTLGIVAPAAFLPVVESRGWMEELNRIVLKKALTDFARLECRESVKLSVNLTPSTLTDLGLPDRLAGMAEKTGVSPSRLVVEVTETGLITETGKALDVLARLRIKGFGISIDDYGTGYSSMAQLQMVPATELKIDRIFVREIDIEASSRTMVGQTIQLAHKLGLSVVAEGNETEAQTRLLTELNCDLAQGFYFSRPRTLPDLQDWLSGRRSGI